MFVNFVCIEKITLKIENTFTALHKLSLQDKVIFNELVIKNDPVKKTTSFFIFMEGI